MPPQTFCAHFSHVLNNSHVTSTHSRNSSLGLSAVAMVTTPPKLSKISVFAHLCPPQTFCAHFSHDSNDSRLTLTQTRSSSFGVSAVAMVTTPLKIPVFGRSVRKLRSYAVLQHMCTLFTCPTRFAVEFATP